MTINTHPGTIIAITRFFAAHNIQPWVGEVILSVEDNTLYAPVSQAASDLINLNYDERVKFNKMMTQIQATSDHKLEQWGINNTVGRWYMNHLYLQYGR